MSVRLSREQHEAFLQVARRAAARASGDDQVVEEAAGHAVVELERYWDQIKPTDAKRRTWVAVVATNRARRVGGKLHRDLPMGAQGSLPPPMNDPVLDARVKMLITEMHTGGGSLGSAVALKVDFEARWGLLSEEAASLLHAKYIDGLRSKEIAKRRGLDETGAQIDHKLAAARQTARPLFEDLLAELRGDHGESAG